MVDQNGDAFTQGDQEHARLDRHDHGRRRDHHGDPLVGTVYPGAATGMPSVYFQNLIVTPTGELGKIDSGTGQQLPNSSRTASHAIDMPDFYLAHTRDRQAEHRLD